MTLQDATNDNIGPRYPRRNGHNYEHDKLSKEIDLIDKWSNYGANNGLFNGNHQKNDPKDDNNNVNDHKQLIDGEFIYSGIHEKLKEAKDNLEDERFSEAMVNTSAARLLYLKALFSKSWIWRFVNLYAGPIWIYMTVFLFLALAFYIYLIDKYFEDIHGVDQAAIHAVTWGCIGGILRGMWYLKDKVSEREYKNSWWIYFMSVPFLGGIFGAIVYLVIIAGLLSLGVGQSNNQGLPQIGRPLVIVPIAALAGFNWEWSIRIFKRIGDLLSPNDSEK
jgi:hypothetical protein